MKEVVRSACRTALLEAGFVPDDPYMDAQSPFGGMCCSQTDHVAVIIAIKRLLDAVMSRLVLVQRCKNTTQLQTWFGGSFEQKIEEGYLKRWELRVILCPHMGKLICNAESRSKAM